MAYFIHSMAKERPGYEPDAREGVAAVYMDSAADVASLPGAERFYETSAAYDTSNGDVYILMSAGWVKQ
jgi:hypothetical protein